MNVLINATSARLGGGITVLRHLLPALLREDKGAHRYTVAARAEVARIVDPQGDRLRFFTPLAAGETFARVLWEQGALPFRKADVLLSVGNVGMLAGRTPQVLLFQNAAPFDAQVRSRASWRARGRLEALRALGIASARRAERVVFLSESARELLLPQLGIPRERTRVVYLGHDPIFRPNGAAEDSSVLCVSQLYFYKNIVELLRGFALAQLPGARLDVAGAQPDEPYSRAVREEIARLGLSQSVRLLGAVPYEDLPKLYASARVFAFPSTCESFPNILVEALAAGAPVACSRLGPMPEICGDAARYFDPFDPEEIAARLRELWQDAAARSELRRKGPLRAAQFTWAEAARGLLQALAEAK